MRTLASIFAVVLQLAAVGLQPRWTPESTIWVWVDPSGAPAAADGLVERAVAAWTKAAAGTITMRRTANETIAGIRVRFAKSPGEFGETRPRIDLLTGVITAADVVIATDTGIDDPLDQRIVIYLTALHELGHGLGLRHTDNFADIMYAFRRPSDGERYFSAYRRLLRSPEDVGSVQVSGLSQNDVAAVRALYGR